MPTFKTTNTMQKFLILLGIAIIIIGILFPFIAKLGLGKLPGDLYFGSKNFKVYIPITTCILISIVITFILWLLKK